MQRWMICGVFPLLLCAGCHAGWAKAPGIAYSQSADSNVTNGTAFDTGVLDLGEHDTIVIPTRAKVEKVAEGNSVSVQLAKRMGFMGHPAVKFSIDEARDEMGCAWRSAGNKLHLATYGEFNSGIEGGKFIDMKVIVPQGVLIERDDSLEMPRDAKGATVSLLSKKLEGKRVWYEPEPSEEASTETPQTPQQIWTPLADEPDLTRMAEKRAQASQSK